MREATMGLLPSLSIEDELIARGDPLSIRAAALIQDTERRMQDLHEQYRPAREAAQAAGELATQAITLIEQLRTHHNIYIRFGAKTGLLRWQRHVEDARQLPARFAAVGITIPPVHGGH
jgi:hypothetical protein